MDRSQGVARGGTVPERHGWWWWLPTVVVLLGLAGAGFGGWWFIRAWLGADPQETLLLTQDKWTLGAECAPRLVVRRRPEGTGIAGARVRLELRQGAQVHLLASDWRTDAAGTLQQPLRVPAAFAPGPADLLIGVRSRHGRDQVSARVTLHQPARLFLSSDKPLYQPGQTIHLRAYAADPVTGRPLVKAPVTFSVQDGKENLVFKQAVTTSRFGIAAADFALATEVNLGRYALTVASGVQETTRTVEVSRYVLPAFRLATTFDRPFSLPGETVTGCVSATYFFGEPVSGAAVELQPVLEPELNASLPKLTGTADAQGRWRFQVPLPATLSGSALHQGDARLRFDLRATDAAGRVVAASADAVAVAAERLKLSLFPENGRLVPQLENRVYVTVATPDGVPVAGCRVTTDTAVGVTGADGVALLNVTPIASPSGGSVAVFATDSAGSRVRADLALPDPATASPVLVRTDKPTYVSGETLRLEVMSSDREGVVFVDLIRGGQTVLARTLAVHAGRARLDLPLSGDLTGDLRLHVYRLESSGEDRGVTRQIVVRQATALRVETRADREVYRPGDTAALAVRLTTPDGRPAPGAVSLSIADERVFHVDQGPTAGGVLRDILAADRELELPRYQLKFFETAAALCGDDATGHRLLEAFLAAVAVRGVLGEQRETIDSLVSKGVLDQWQADRLRRAANDPLYRGFYSKHPEFQEALRLLQPGSGLYPVFVQTGPLKEETWQLRRHKFREMLSFAAVYLVIAGAMFLAAYGDATRALAEFSRLPAAMQTLFGFKVSLQMALTGLILGEPFFYFVGLALGAGTRVSVWPGHTAPAAVVVLLPLYSLLVFTVCRWQCRRARRLPAAALEEAPQLPQVPWYFFAQYLIFRVAIAGTALSGASGLLVVLLGIVAFIMACVFIDRIDTCLPIVIRPDGKPAPGGSRVVEVLVVIAIIAILAGMLLPALGSARSTSRKLSALNDLRQLDAALELARDKGTPAATAAPRVRREFPETLYWAPELVTDDTGCARAEVPLADSITTWRVNADAVTAAGCQGAAQSGLRVFQPFFIEPDLPESVALGDELCLPVACHNYLDTAQTLTVQLTLADGVTVASPPSGSLPPPLQLTLPAHGVGAVQVPLRFTRVGEARLRFEARAGTEADAVERTVRVLPTGERVAASRAGVLSGPAEFALNLPPAAIPGSASLVAKVYPSRFTEILDGLDALFAAPYGCFEQTSSVTYPNLLALRYLRETGRSSPAAEVRALKFIGQGYQRLLTFQVMGGGFEWFGSPPANVCLTAYGLLELTDMAKVTSVDPKVISGAVSWLLGQQQGDGAWADPPRRGWTWSGRGAMTAFVAWAAETAAPALRIDVAYDRTQLASGQPLACDVRIATVLAAVPMAIVDLGVPAGFSVDTAAFEALVASGILAKYEVAARQIILYVRELRRHEPLRLRYTLTARYPLRVAAPPAAVYEYYNPASRATAPGPLLQVR